MSDDWGCAGLMEEWQKLGPSPFGKFDGCNSSDDTRSGMSNEITKKIGQKGCKYVDSVLT